MLEEYLNLWRNVDQMAIDRHKQFEWKGFLEFQTCRYYKQRSLCEEVNRFISGIVCFCHKQFKFNKEETGLFKYSNLRDNASLI